MMENSNFNFLDSLRYASTLEQLRKEFMSHAEFFESNKDWVIVDEETSTCIGFDTFFARKTKDAANNLLAFIEEEMDTGVFDEKKRVKLHQYITELTSLAEKFKGYFHLENFSFVEEHTSRVIQNLKTHYLLKEGVTDSEIAHTGSLKVKWTGGIASLATMFFELQTECFDGHPQPFVKASKPELIRFIFNHFVDENGEPFSESTLATYLDPNKPEKKAKRKKVPLNDILAKKKQ